MVRRYGRGREVVVPAGRPVDLSRRRGRQVRAALLSPITLPVDVALGVVAAPLVVVAVTLGVCP